MHNIYKEKKVFLTGHTGFKGAWLQKCLEKLGAEVLGYSLAPENDLSLYTILQVDSGLIADVLDYEKLEDALLNFQPDIIFHLAAQSLVRKSYFEPVRTYQTNIIGTLNLLEAARKCQSVKVFINVTTDKCYENKEMNYAYKEDDPMGGHDMYSSSKACVEILSSSYRLSFLQKSFALATVRAGNVIGGGDFAEDRILPDCVKALHKKEKITIRNPYAIRPWQHVLEPLFGYLLLGKKILTEGAKYAQAYNFGPEASSNLDVYTLTRLICQKWGEGEHIEIKSDPLHEAQLLMLDTTKAKKMLDWQPLYNVEQAVAESVAWYKAFYSGNDMKAFTIDQIEKYSQLLIELLRRKDV